MPKKQCDHTSVAILARDNARILFIERKQYNPGFALPAGHGDGMRPHDAAAKELREETGLLARRLEERLTLDLANPCARENGTRHRWTVFEAIEWEGIARPDPEETKQVFWADPDDIRRFAQRLESFAANHAIPLTAAELPRLVNAVNADPGWAAKPGLEPPMYILFKELGLL